MDIIIEGIPADNGSMKWDNPAEVLAYLKAYKGQRLVFNVKPAIKQSAKQKLYNYLHKAILPVLAEELTKDGWEMMDIYRADKVLKDLIARDLIYNPVTKEEIVSTEDKRDMSKERLLKYVVDALFLIETQYGRHILSGDEYKEMLANQKKEHGNER